MKVFIQNEAGSPIKHIHNEKTLELLGTKKVSRPYPLPYGFVVETSADDGMNVDCFVLTDKELQTGEVVDCDPIGLMEQIENGETDHNVLAVLSGEERVLDINTKNLLTDFVNHVFDHIQGHAVTVGDFLGREAAFAYISSHLDPVPKR